MRILEKFIKNLKGFIYLFAKKRDRGCYVLGWTRLKSGASSGSPTMVAEAQVLEPSPIAFQGTLERSWIRSGGPVGYQHHHSLTYNLKTRALPHHLHGFVCVCVYIQWEGHFQKFPFSSLGIDPGEEKEGRWGEGQAGQKTHRHYLAGRRSNLHCE